MSLGIILFYLLLIFCCPCIDGPWGSDQWRRAGGVAGEGAQSAAWCLGWGQQEQSSGLGARGPLLQSNWRQSSGIHLHHPQSVEVMIGWVDIDDSCSREQQWIAQGVQLDPQWDHQWAPNDSVHWKQRFSLGYEYRREEIENSCILLFYLSTLFRASISWGADWEQRRGDASEWAEQWVQAAMQVQVREINDQDEGLLNCMHDGVF